MSLNDDYPDGSFGDLMLGAPLDAKFEYCSDDDTNDKRDSFRFSVEADELYEIRLTPNGHSLFFQNPALLATEFLGRIYEPLFPNAYSFIFRSSAAGQEFVDIVSTFNHDDEKNYTLDFSKYEIPEGPTSRIIMKNGVPKDSKIESTYDRDSFLADLKEGFTYRFDLKGASTGDGTMVDPLLRLYKGYTDYDLIRTDNDGGEGNNASIVYTADSNEVHYLTAAGLLENTGTYEISLTILDYMDDFAADSSTMGRIETPGPGRVTGTTGKLEIEKDVDWHKIDLVKGRWYQFNSKLPNGFSLPPYTRLRHPTGALVDEARVVNGTYYRAQQTGTYYFQMGDHRDSYRGLKLTGNYSIYVTDNAPPRVSASPTPILVGDSTRNANEFLFLNGFPADRIQLISEADFYVGSTVFEKFRAHVIPATDFENIQFDATLKRGAYDVSLRTIGAGTFSNWAATTIYSYQHQSFYLDIGKAWDSTNTESGTDDVITYRFADVVPSYFAAGRFENFAEVAASVKAAINGVFSATATNGLESMTNLKFEYSDSESADIQIFAADSSAMATGFWPGKFGLGDLVLNRDIYSGDVTTDPGSFQYFQLLKGIGAVMGLKPDQPALTRLESVMGSKFVDTSGQPFPETFGILDGEQLHDMYGYNVEFEETDDFFQRFSLGNTDESFVRTIHKDAARDQISAVESARPATIDLRPGAVSFLRGAGPWQSYIASGVRNAVGTNLNDTIIGGYYANDLSGYAGDDVLTGLSGNDHLSGGEGNDRYIYETGDGDDTINEHDRTGIDTLQLTGKFGLSSVESDLTFQKLGRHLQIRLDMYDQPNRDSGKIMIREFSDSGRVERLDLRNFSEDLGVYSLVSVFNRANSIPQRFAPTGASDAFGLVLAPVG